MQMKIPSFFGEKGEPEVYQTWENYVNLYFENHHVQEKEKFRVVFASLHGRAERWCYRFIKDYPSNLTWEEFRKAMRKKYGLPQTCTVSNGMKFS